MGNPCRHVFNNDFFIKRPEIDGKIVKITSSWASLVNLAYDSKKLIKHYDKAIIDSYSAPDVCLRYSNGNSCKDEWQRYGRFEFINLNIISVKKPMLDDDPMIATFEFDKVENIWNESIMATDMPFGKFQGMTEKEVSNYKRKNVFFGSPKPTKEAIEAAKAQSQLSYDDIEKILIEAYKIDF